MAADMHYREAGMGDAVVLLHAGPGLDGSIFFPWFDRLAATHRVIALDLPGNGQSEDGDRGDWTLSGHADAVERLLAELDLGDYTLLGHSFGGFVALTHAVEHPGSAARIVASCSAASEGALHGFGDRLAALEPPEARERVAAAFEREDEVQTPEDCHSVWLDQLPFFVARPVPELADALERVTYRPDAMTHEDYGDLDLRSQLRNVDVPLLAIGGELDRSTPPEATEEIARCAADGEAVILERVGHFPYAEDPDAYFTVIGDWLEETAPAG